MFVIDALVYRRNLTLGCVVGIDSDVVLVQRLEVTAVSCESLGYVVLRYEAAERFRGLVSLTDGVDNELRPCIDIASDKDARIVCLIGEGICHRIIAVMEGDVVPSRSLPHSMA